MAQVYHYPPELLQLLVDTIPRLCRSKRDLLTFFRGAGVSGVAIDGLERELDADRDAVGKYQIARTVLVGLNERGDDGALRQRREVLKRVVEFEDFSTCWPNDRLQAQGLVAQVQKVVNAKDTFTRMTQERDAERQQRMAAAQVGQDAAHTKRALLAGALTAARVARTIVADRPGGGLGLPRCRCPGPRSRGAR
jgi:hypothetical protein